MLDSVFHAVDHGYVVVGDGRLYWTGFGWDPQLRNAKIYHSLKYAMDVMAANQDKRPFLLPVETRVTGHQVNVT